MSDFVRSGVQQRSTSRVLASQCGEPGTRAMSSSEPGDGLQPRVISSPPIPSVPSEKPTGLDARLASAQSSNLDTTIQPASGTGDSSDHTGEGRGLPSSVPQQHPQQQQQQQPLQPQPGRSTSPAASIRGSDDGWPSTPAVRRDPRTDFQVALLLRPVRYTRQPSEPR